MASQLALGGVPVHEPLHSPSQVASHEPLHLALQSEFVPQLALHSPVQSALQSSEQFAWQSNSPGSTSQEALQPSISQLPVHEASTPPLHSPLQLA